MDLIKAKLALRYRDRCAFLSRLALEQIIKRTTRKELDFAEHEILMAFER